MNNVATLRRKGRGGPPPAAAYIDGASYVLLLEITAGYLALGKASEGASQQPGELLRLNGELQALTERFTPPQGAA
ncbi:hypothetical protein [Pseudomonas sp. dw_358]|uniref:hypothetical protein n=1 Tax=Pseudomonas sp. dw_358 TaxID=2720083 RepID=UPI001BD4DDB0|nr:hypothetical protein [Pseudomonas sp. dw_358]